MPSPSPLWPQDQGSQHPTGTGERLGREGVYLRFLPNKNTALFFFTIAKMETKKIPTFEHSSVCRVSCLLGQLRPHDTVLTRQGNRRANDLHRRQAACSAPPGLGRKEGCTGCQEQGSATVLGCLFRKACANQQPLTQPQGCRSKGHPCD